MAWLLDLSSALNFADLSTEFTQTGASAMTAEGIIFLHACLLVTCLIANYTAHVINVFQHYWFTASCM